MAEQDVNFYEATLRAIRDFPFWDYGMDDVDPKSEYAEWVPDLANEISNALREVEIDEAMKNWKKVK